MSVSTTITLDKRRVKQKTGKYPVKLLVTYEREPMRYQTIYELSEEEFKKLSAPRISSELQKMRDKLRELQWQSEKIARGLEPFSFEEFEKDFILNHPDFKQRKSIKKVLSQKTAYKFDRSLYEHRFPIFKEKEVAPGTILEATLLYVDKLLQEHRIGSAVSYQTSYYAFTRFRGNVRFTDITVSFRYFKSAISFGLMPFAR